METSESNKIQGASALSLGLNKMLHDIGHSKKMESVTPNLPFLRPGTELPVVNVDFIIGGAGLGDLIAAMPSFIFMANFCPWVFGTIVCPDYFRDFAINIMRPFSNWKIHDSDTIKHKPGTIVCAPGVKVDGVIRQPLCNGTGGTLVGNYFINLVNVFPPPEGSEYYPVIDFESEILSEQCWELHDRWKNKCVVLTPGAVSKARTVNGLLWSPIVGHIKRLGMLPVFLGKTQLSKDLVTNFPDMIPFEQGLDLRDKTTMIEAAFIMKNSACVIGLDNGLLHLAACTDANIVAAFNITEPSERIPKRKNGKFIPLTITREELSCAHCQTNIKRIFPHSFTNCLYGDLKCVDLLFRNNGEMWKNAIDEIIS